MTLMLCWRIFPEITPKTTVCISSSRILKVALGSTSITVPSSLTPSSLAKIELYSFHTIPTETAPGLLAGIPHHAYIWIGFFWIR